jgi:hypothetical protein
MDWRSKAFVMWHSLDSPYPEPSDLQSVSGDEWTYAVEALNDVYLDLEHGRGSTEAPWLITDDGFTLGPSDIEALRPDWEAYVRKHGRDGQDIPSSTE